MQYPLWFNGSKPQNLWKKKLFLEFLFWARLLLLLLVISSIKWVFIIDQFRAWQSLSWMKGMKWGDIRGGRGGGRQILGRRGYYFRDRGISINIHTYRVYTRIWTSIENLTYRVSAPLGNSTENATKKNSQDL